MSRSKDIWVLETEDDAFIGQIEVAYGATRWQFTVTVYTGRNGRPPVVDAADIVRLIPASRHPDVVFV